ncbi:MAG: MYXO-CTERM sorting domain-containing protein [Polyangiaceae bacterium]
MTSVAGAVDYSAQGPEAFTTTDFANGTAGSLGGKLVVPNKAGKYPILVNTHGFSGNADQQIGWGEHFASYGFVAVVPSIPGGLPPDHKANGDIIVALAKLFSDPAYVSPAQGKVDGSKVGLSGHSAGGLQTTFAASILKPRATVLFDPVDYQGIGKPVYGTLCSPVMGIFAEPGGCNVQAEWSTFKTTAQGPLVLFDVIGSNHCDPIKPLMGPICDIGCGGVSSEKNQANYSRYATAFFLANLKDDAAAAATFTASVLSADTAIRSSSVKDAPSCAGSPTDGGTDGGGGSIDASVPDVVVADVTVDSAIDVGSPDAPTSIDVVRDTTTGTDARIDASVDVTIDAPPAIDATMADAIVPPTSEPPATDAGTGGAGGSGGSSSTTGTGGSGGSQANAEKSGCDCSLAGGAPSSSRGSLAALLLAALVVARRRSRV